MRHGKSKGYGFVEFENEEDQLKALESVKDVTLEDRAIYLKVALSDQQQQKVADEKEEDKEEQDLESAVEALKINDTKK
jgi:RNA recognition motif-containing protein